MIPVAEVAVKLAESGKTGQLDLLFKQHYFSLCPFILTIPVETYCQLLPGRSPPSIGQNDCVECLNNLPEHVIRTEPVAVINWPTTNEILTWYKERAQDIDKFSGRLDNSICLIEYGCRRGMYELQQFLDDALYLQQIVYNQGDDDDDDENEMHCLISLAEWENMTRYEKFKAVLKGCKGRQCCWKVRRSCNPFYEG